VSDPKPLNPIWDWYTESTVMKTNADAPETAAVHGFELKRRMCRILLKKLIVTPSKFLNLRW